MLRTEVHKKEVAKIHKKYNFLKHIDLFKSLNCIPTAIALCSSLPRNSDTRKQIEKLTSDTNNLINTLRNTQTHTKNIITRTPDDLVQLGYSIVKNKNPYWQLSSFEKDLDIFHTSCLFALQKIPADSTGRNKGSIPGFVIFQLIPIYHIGTGCEPTCGWADQDDKGVGEFYEFVLDLTYLLREMIVKNCTLIKMSANPQEMPIKTLRKYTNNHISLISHNQSLYYFDKKIKAIDMSLCNKNKNSHLHQLTEIFSKIFDGSSRPATIDELELIKSVTGCHFGIELGTDKSIRTYCTEALKHYRQVLKEPKEQTLQE